MKEYSEHKIHSRNNLSEQILEMLELANSSNRDVRCDFNYFIPDFFLIVRKGERAWPIIWFCQQELDRKDEEYKNSSEGKEAARKKAEELRRLQCKHYMLMSQLEDLDFTNSDELMEWLRNYQECSDDMRVEKYTEVVVRIFKERYDSTRVRCYKKDNDETIKDVIEFLQRNGNIHPWFFWEGRK